MINSSLFQRLCYLPLNFIIGARESITPEKIAYHLQIPMETPELDAALSTRYLVGRAATANANPRGKHHRRPLGWERKKLVKADGWRDDGYEYQNYLWDLQKRENPIPCAPLPSASGRLEKPHFMTLFLVHQKRNRRISYRCGCEYDDPFLINEARLKVWRGDCQGAMKDGLEMAEGGDDDEDTVIGEDEGEGIDGALGGGEAALATVAREEPVYTVRYRPRRRKAPSRTGGAVLTPVGTLDGGEIDGDWRSDWEWEFLARENARSCRCRSESEVNSDWTGVSSTCEWDMGSEALGREHNSL